MTQVFVGMLCGLIISLVYSFGPAFFSLLHTSVHYGFRRAAPLPFGVNFSDWITCLLLLTVLRNVSMTQILHNPTVVFVGGGVLAGFGIYFFTRKTRDAENTGSVLKFRNEDAPHPMAVWFRGFLINFFNPLIWIYWLSIITLASGTFEYEGKKLFLFFVGVLVITLSGDLLKCKLASMLQRFLTARVLNIFNKIVGCILFGFAAYLVISLLLGLK